MKSFGGGDERILRYCFAATRVFEGSAPLGDSGRGETTEDRGGETVESSWKGTEKHAARRNLGVAAGRRGVCGMFVWGVGVARQIATRQQFQPFFVCARA